MGLFGLLEDIVTLPIAVVTDVVTLDVENTLEKLGSIAVETVDTLT